MAVFIFAADLSFVHLHDAAELLSGSISAARILWHMQWPSQATEAHNALNLEGAHSLLAGQHQVGDFKPVAERLVGVLEDRPGKQREPIAACGAFRALPMTACSEASYRAGLPQRGQRTPSGQRRAIK